MALVHLGCALRNKGDGAGWHIINDAGHRPVGITGVTTHPTHLEIQHAVGAIRVVTSSVTVDETFAASGLHVGASVGQAFSRIELFDGCPSMANPAVPLDPATVSAPYGNVWVYLLLEK